MSTVPKQPTRPRACAKCGAPGAPISIGARSICLDCYTTQYAPAWRQAVKHFAARAIPIAQQTLDDWGAAADDPLLAGVVTTDASERLMREFQASEAAQISEKRGPGAPHRWTQTNIEPLVTAIRERRQALIASGKRGSQEQVARYLYKRFDYATPAGFTKEVYPRLKTLGYPWPTAFNP